MRVPEHLKDPAARKRRAARARARRTEERRNIRSSESPLPELLVEKKPALLLFFLALLVVVGGLLAGRSKFQIETRKKTPAGDIAMKDLKALRIALERFRHDCRRYPSTEEGLKSLVSDDDFIGWRGYYVNLIRPDPWYRRYRYRLEGEVVVLLSLGFDGMEGTPDDIIPPEPSAEEIAGDFGKWGDDEPEGEGELDIPAEEELLQELPEAASKSGGD
jgi:type II secretion system protein G